MRGSDPKGGQERETTAGEGLDRGSPPHTTSSSLLQGASLLDTRVQLAASRTHAHTHGVFADAQHLGDLAARHLFDLVEPESLALTVGHLREKLSEELQGGFAVEALGRGLVVGESVRALVDRDRVGAILATTKEQANHVANDASDPVAQGSFARERL